MQLRVPDLVLDLRGQRELPLQRRRAEDPVALGQHAHQLRVAVHLDELDRAARGTRRASSRRSRPARRTGRSRGTPACACPRCWPPYRTVVSIECNGYEARRAHTRGRTALRGARLPRHVDGRARAGARRSEGVALLADRLEAGPPLRGDARGRATRSTPRSTPCPTTRRPSSASGSRCAVTCASSPSSSTWRRCSPASGATSRASIATRSSPSAAATRSAGARSSARASSRASSAPTSTSGAATLLVLSAANWAYTWLEPGRDTDELADRFTAILVDGDPRLRDTPRERLLIVNPFASGVDEHRLAAVTAALPDGTSRRASRPRPVRRRRSPARPSARSTRSTCSAATARTTRC